MRHAAWVLVLPLLFLARQAGARAPLSADAPAEPSDRSRLAIGLSIGTPGYANLTGRYSLRNLSLRLSGGFGGGARAGAQGEVALHALQGPDLRIGVALVAGTFSARAGQDGGSPPGALRTQRYLGAAYDMVLDRFHL